MEMCDLGENSPPFVSMPLSAMRTAVDFLSGERNKLSTVPLSRSAPYPRVLLLLPGVEITVVPLSRIGRPAPRLTSRTCLIRYAA